MEKQKIPTRVVPRLSRYYRILREFDDKPWVSSRELSAETGFTDTQIRRDFTYFGHFGNRGKGYNVEELKKSLKKILGLDKSWNVMLVGAGNLGKALLGYKGFLEQGFKIVAAFDEDSSKIEKNISGIIVYPMSKLADIVKEKQIKMAILTVPESVCQEVAEQVVASGVKAIFNFAPKQLKLPSDVKVRHIDMTVEIERLSFMVSRQ